MTQVSPCLHCMHNKHKLMQNTFDVEQALKDYDKSTNNGFLVKEYDVKHMDFIALEHILTNQNSSSILSMRVKITAQDWEHEEIEKLLKEEK